MNTLQHLREPSKLLLTWQGLDSSSDPNMRTRRVVAELIPNSTGNSARLQYLLNTPDFDAAVDNGFEGYPAFRLPKSPGSTGAIVDDAMPALMRRLPPRKREDFEDYLKRHLLPANFSLSDFALLGYTGARLPSDGFGLVPIFSPDVESVEILTELAGTRYHVNQEQLAQISLDDDVRLVSEPGNVHDSNAICAKVGDLTIGYINRVMATNVNEWRSRMQVTATIARKNGTTERPLIYVRIAASAK